jgi:signal transduction histidine kinase
LNSLTRRFFLLSLLLFGSLQLFSQTNTEVDNIKQRYKNGQEFLKQKKYEKALTVFTIGLEDSKKIENSYLIAEGYYAVASYYKKKRNSIEGIANTNKAIIIFKNLNDNEQVYNCYLQLGYFYIIKDQYQKSLEEYFSSLKLAESIKDSAKVALSLEKIGEVYLLTPNLEKAKFNFEKAIDIFTELNNERSVMFNLTNLGAAYQKEGNLEKAIPIFEKGLEIARKLGEERSESIFLGNIGSSNRALLNYEVSLDYLFKALTIKLRQGNFTSIAHTYNDISETYIEMKDLLKAKKYALKAVEYSKGHNLRQERYAYYILSNIEYDLENFKASHENLKAYQKIEDSIFSIEKTRSINELQIEFESEKKNLKIEAQRSNIALLDSKNKIKTQWLIFGSLSLLAIFILITLQKSRSNAKKDKLLQEKFSQDLLISQEKERTKIAKELHDSVGQQLTLIKIQAQNSSQIDIAQMTNTALEEVRSISRGLYPALLKQLGLKESIEMLVNEYDERTDLFFSVDIDDIDIHFTESTSLNFYRLIQECLNNIIKHAKAKSVTVNIEVTEDKIVALISDNGQGFDVNDNQKKNSLGLKTIFERIKIMDGKISIDSKLDIGTSFIFSIPLKVR